MEGLIVDDSSQSYSDNPEELEYQERMRQSKRKADTIWREDGGTPEDEDDED